MRINYREFIPPEELATKDVKSWSKYEAKKYFEWFLKEKENRILLFKTFINGANEFEDLLKETFLLFLQNGFIVGKKGDCVLTNLGYALAADFGIYLGEIIINKREDLNWKLVKVPKSDPCYNLPVISGYTSKPDYFDPVGISITNWNQILNEKEDLAFFIELLEYSLKKP